VYNAHKEAAMNKAIAILVATLLLCLSVSSRNQKEDLAAPKLVVRISSGTDQKSIPIYFSILVLSKSVVCSSHGDKTPFEYTITSDAPVSAQIQTKMKEDVVVLQVFDLSKSKNEPIASAKGHSIVFGKGLVESSPIFVRAD
jgi:hypothetical protein